MNEELKIIISAVNTEAKKALKEVKDELEKVEESGKKSGKSLKESMASVKKGVTVAIGAIAAVTTALVAFGKSTVEVQKEISRLNAAFESAGSSAKQAGETYKSIFGFLGDSGAAVEAAQQLASITPDTAKLKEYETILQGVYATWGTSIDTGGLAEGINHTIALGEGVQGTLADAFEFAGVSVDAVNAKLASFNTEAEREAYIRSTLISMYGTSAAIYEQNNAALIANNQSQASLNIALAEAGKAVMPLMTAFNNLSTVLLTSLKPALEVIAAVLAIVVQVITTAIGWIASLFSIFSGGSSKAAEQTKSIGNNIANASKSAKTATGGVGGLNKALGDAAKSAQELKKQTMGFDELNVVTEQSTSSGGGSSGAGAGGAGVSIPDMSALTDFEMPNLDEFKQSLDDVKEKAQAILVLAGIVGAAFLAWKLATILSDVENVSVLLEGLKTKLTNFGGYLLIIAGAVLLVQGYCDAWVNGIDWGNLGVMLAGIAAIIAGIAIVAGTLAAGIATIAGGVALLVIGIKDFVTNGYSMQNVLTILAGVIAIVVGVCLAFNAALLANPITWIVIAIASLVAAFVILWNECDGFRQFWLDLWEKVKQLFDAFVKSIQPLIDAFVGAFKAAWEAIKAVWDFVKPYFETLWNNIKVIFSVVKDVLSAFFSAAWEAIKIVWNQVISYFTAIWETIKGIFSVVKDVLTGNWQGAWDGIKGIVNTWKDYFKNTWENIKKIFSVVGTYFKDVFSAAWNGIKQVFANWGTFFSGLWDGIKNTFSKLGTSIGNAISGAVKSGINGVISLIEKTINNAIKLINGGIDLINLIPGVSVKHIGKLTLPRLAKGGIVDGATIAMIGEQGKEAVVPLENNTEWIDKLADRLSDTNKAPSKIVLMVDGKELGWATINNINGITKQTGNLQLVLG